MNNFKVYVQELRKAFSMFNDYTLDQFITSEDDMNHAEYLIPEKASKVRERRKKERKSRSHVIMVHRNSDAYDFFITEFRGNKLSEDEFGNVLVPESDYYTSHKTR